MTQQQEYEHESYGTITFSNQHGPPRNVFGTPIQHSDVIRVDIHSATLIRSLSNDHILNDEQLFSGYLSQAQLAQAILTMAGGPPTPITLQHVRGDTRLREEPPTRNRTELFDAETLGVLDELMTQCDELVEATKGTAHRKAQGLRAALENRLPFIANRMRETHHRTADEAVQEMNASINRTLRQAGLEAIVNRPIPSLPEPEIKDEQANSK